MEHYNINYEIVKQINTIREWFRNNKFIVWGTGELCQYYIKKNRLILGYIELFIDSECQKHNKFFNDIKICSPESINDLGNDYIFVCGSDKYYNEIREQLIHTYNIKEENIMMINQWFEKMMIYGIVPPTRMRLEVSTMCQLKCTECYMRKNQYGTLGCGNLRIDDFRKIIEENEYLEEIEISNSGEVFLNPDLVEILDEASKKNIKITIKNGVNFNNVSDEQIEALVKYNVTEITFSIDGATQKVYQTYRNGGDINKVIDNIKKLNITKKKYNSEMPKLKWQFILMPHNICEINEAKKIADDLDMIFDIKLNWDNEIIFCDEVKKITGMKYVTRKQYNEEHEIDYGNACAQFIMTPQFNWDGRMLGCCQIFMEDFGFNILETKLIDIVNDIRTIYIRKFLMEKFEDINSNYYFPCKKCEHYLHMKKRGGKILI